MDTTNLQAVQHKPVGILIREAYREGFRIADGVTKNAAYERLLSMPDHIAAICDALPDAVDQEHYTAAWIDGVTDAHMSYEPLTDQQIDIHYD